MNINITIWVGHLLPNQEKSRAGPSPVALGPTMHKNDAQLPPMADWTDTHTHTLTHSQSLTTSQNQQTLAVSNLGFRVIVECTRTHASTLAHPQARMQALARPCMYNRIACPTTRMRMCMRCARTCHALA